MKILINDKKSVERFQKEISISSAILILVFGFRFIGSSLTAIDYPLISKQFFLSFILVIFYGLAMFSLAIRKNVKHGLIYGCIGTSIELFLDIIIIIFYGFIKKWIVSLIVNLFILILIYKGIKHIKSLDMVEVESSTAQ